MKHKEKIKMDSIIKFSMEPYRLMAEEQIKYQHCSTCKHKEKCQYPCRSAAHDEIDIMNEIIWSMAMLN